jgi:hypothetical protein
MKIKNRVPSLSKTEQKKFYDWLEQFISDKGYMLDGEYFVKIKDGNILYQSTYEWYDWLDSKYEEYLNK